MKRRTALCTFEGYDKEYAFKTYDETLSAGDYVLVDTANGARIVRIAAIGGDAESKADAARKFVLSKVDFTAYEKGKEIDAKSEELKERMKKRYEEISEIAKYKLIANDDPELASLLKSYEEIMS